MIVNQNRMTDWDKLLRTGRTYGPLIKSRTNIPQNPAENAQSLETKRTEGTGVRHVVATMQPPRNLTFVRRQAIGGQAWDDTAGASMYGVPVPRAVSRFKRAEGGGLVDLSLTVSPKVFLKRLKRGLGSMFDSVYSGTLKIQALYITVRRTRPYLSIPV